MNSLFKKKVLYVMLFGVLLAGVATYYKLSNKSIEVRKVNLINTIVKKSVSAGGSIKSFNEVDLSFQNTSQIDSIAVKDGNNVVKGQLLATLDTKALYSDTQVAKDARDLALRNKDLFLAQYQNHQNNAGGSIQYGIKIRQFDEQISSAQAAYDYKLNLIQKSYIYAPFDGTIIDVFKKQSETATIGESVIKLADLNNLYFEIRLDQEDFGQIRSDQTVNISLDAYANHTFTGRVVYVPLYSKANDNFLIKIAIISDNSDYRFLLGMTGDANIVTAQTPNEVKAISFDVINYNDGNKPYVWIVNNGVLKKQNIEIGLEGDLFTEITNDVIGEVVSPGKAKEGLKEGVKVKIIK